MLMSNCTVIIGFALTASELKTVYPKITPTFGAKL